MSTEPNGVLDADGTDDVDDVDDAVAQIVEIVVTGPEDVMATIADSLVCQRFAACVQLAQVRSTYRWQGGVEQEMELRATIHTTRSRQDDAVQRVYEMHPYEVPCVLVLDPADVSDAYARWVAEGCEPAPDATDRAEGPRADI